MTKKTKCKSKNNEDYVTIEIIMSRNAWLNLSENVRKGNNKIDTGISVTDLIASKIEKLFGKETIQAVSGPDGQFIFLKL